MNNNVYDFLNKLQRWLPLLGTLYLGLCKVWGLPLGSEINQTIILVEAFLAGVLEIATSNYNKSKKVELEEIEFKKYED